MKMTAKQVKALERTFNHKTVQNMKTEEYRGYIEQICALSLSTIIANEGIDFAKGFVEAALNNTEPVAIAQQLKPH